MESKIKVLVVDDSAFMRKSISIFLESDKDIEVIGIARDGIDGIEKAKKLNPDLITLDIEMPRMNGLEALKVIKSELNIPVIMISSLTSEGADATIEALANGADDFIPKDITNKRINLSKVQDEITTKVKLIVKQKARRLRLQKLSKEVSAPPISNFVSLPRNKIKAIAMGISTGGPLSLQKVIPKLSPNINVPFFIVQHMPPKFTLSLAHRLDSMSDIKVKEAENGEEVKNNVVYIAQGGKHMKFKKNLAGDISINITPYPSNTLHKPSVDVMISSFTEMFQGNGIGIIMTGMGHDGLEGIKELKHAGGFTISQDEASSVIYGMPKAIADNGLSDMILPLDSIADIINKNLT